MKKKILSIAVLLASVFTVSSMAQTPSCPQQCANHAECQAQKGKCNVQYSPFAGLDLTDKQKSELEALKPSKEQIQAKKDQAKAQKRADRQQRREQKMQYRKDYLAKVKNILTPDQYVQFLENSYINQVSKDRYGKKGKDKKGHRHNGGKKEMKSQRSEKQK